MGHPEPTDRMKHIGARRYARLVDEWVTLRMRSISPSTRRCEGIAA
jgi:hypothetical protein